MNKPTYLPKPNRPFPKESELLTRIDSLVEEYITELSAVAVMGILFHVATEISVRATATDPD